MEKTSDYDKLSQSTTQGLSMMDKLRTMSETEKAEYLAKWYASLKEGK